MISNMEYYKVFYYVGKLSSITEAAKELNISQPAVSQSIHQLEKSLDCTLFQRTARGMKLTSEGNLLYRYVKRGYEQIDLGQQRLGQLLHLDAGEVRIGASDMTLRFFLLPYLEKFHELYPGIKVSVTNGPTPETLQYLSDDRIDFGVVSTPLEGRTSTRDYIEAFLAKENVEIHPEFELATSDMIVQFALRNLGVGCVVKDFAKEYLDSGILFELRFNKMIPKRQMCVVIDE